MRLFLPIRLTVATFFTLTLNLVSTALRISILFASGSTTNATLFWDS